MTTSTLTVVAYDVVSDARRTRLHALLKEYGIPVQKSAFEARLTPAERQELLRRAATLLDATSDRLTMYPISAGHEDRILTYGLRGPVSMSARSTWSKGLWFTRLGKKSRRKIADLDVGPEVIENVILTGHQRVTRGRVCTPVGEVMGN